MVETPKRAQDGETISPNQCVDTLIHNNSEVVSLLNLGLVHGGDEKIQFKGVKFELVNQLAVKMNRIYGMEISIKCDDGTLSSEMIPKFVAMCACKMFDEMPQRTKGALNLGVKSSNQPQNESKQTTSIRHDLNKTKTQHK